MDYDGTTTKDPGPRVPAAERQHRIMDRAVHALAELPPAWRHDALQAAERLSQQGGMGVAAGLRAEQDQCGSSGPERLSLSNVVDAFTYQPWDPGQADAGDQVREVLTAAARVILRTVPESPMRTRALNDLIDARMKANAAISFRGRF